MNEDRVLAQFRSVPSDRNFAAVERAYRPWMRAVAGRVLRDVPRLGDGYLDDVVSEGLLAMARSARRYVHVCAVCDAPFTRRCDLAAHAVAAHRLRGVPSAVSLRQFCETTARLALRRTALRALSLEEPSENVGYDVGVGGEAELASRLLVEEACAKLSGAARRVLERLLDARRPFAVPAAVLGELRDAFADLAPAHAA